MPEEISFMFEVFHKLVQSIYDDSQLDDMYDNANTNKVEENKLNENFNKKEFQKLWSLINNKYSYYVDFDSEELIKKSVDAINKNLYVTQLMYTVSTGEQKTQIDAEEIKNSVAFKNAKTKTEIIRSSASDTIQYDLLGKVCSQTSLTRKTVSLILSQIDPIKFMLYKDNPEEFINKTSIIINEQKASLVVSHVQYNKIDGKFDSNIFIESKSTQEFKQAYKSMKHITDFVIVDAVNKEKGVERKFAEDLDLSDEVCVYAKLPKGKFYIPTPVGNYSPDWAIAFVEGTVKHIYFIAETKGSLDSMQMRKIEDAKIECAKKLFNKISTDNVKYENVTNYTDLLNKMNSL